ncbi:beta carbonic anhydrase 5, chloroplastic-like isoform X2 [Tasmannia lanceolata]|uniref:beta carbonic anhydrase 5, chloroplastic-like isoform X2 n=1 Tax=Tasmannia lanceolata TaxID=3420 RepID=UPI004062EA38
MAAFPQSLSKYPPFVNSFLGLPRKSLGTRKIFGSQWKYARIGENHLRQVGFVRKNPTSKLEASKEALGLTQEITSHEWESLNKTSNDLDPFGEMKHRFLRFRRQQFLENSVHFQNLAEAQVPKFLVIACADSRVCPSVILGLQPGEAFMVRSVANLVPPIGNDISETRAALEFAVNTLEVENILVIGHSRCGGIRALMSMQDEVDSSGSFISKWVSVGKSARSSTKAAAANLSFDQQCRHCEKESVNRSMLNLLTYPWIEKRVSQGILSVHGGYYDFINCTFEKWTLEYRGSMEDNIRYAIKDHSFWC